SGLRAGRGSTRPPGAGPCRSVPTGAAPEGAGPAQPSRSSATSFRPAAMSFTSPTTSTRERRTSRTECSPFWRALPFRAARAFPSGVLGPVVCSQGRFARAACRSRSRPSGVSPRRFCRFTFPAATRLGLGEGGFAVMEMLPHPVVLTSHFGGGANLHPLGRRPVPPPGRALAPGRPAGLGAGLPPDRPLAIRLQGEGAAAEFRLEAGGRGVAGRHRLEPLGGARPNVQPADRVVGQG